MRSQICFCWMALALAFSFRAGSQAAEADLPIYTDQMVNQFEVWGWAPHTLVNTNPVHSGNRSISVTAPEWAGLYIHHTDLNTSGFTNLSLWAHGGESGGQILRVSAKVGTNDSPGYSLPPLPAQKWQQFVIPLDVLGASNITNFSGFLVLLQGDSPTNTFYLDDIQLEAPVAPAPAPKVKESQVAPVTVPPTHQSQQPTPPSGGGKDATGLWIAAALASIIGLLVWLILVIKRSALGISTTQSVALIPRPGIDPMPAESASPETWQQRALVAEALATRQAQILQKKLVPEMAEFAKTSLVQGLASQRNALIETQQRAERELVELEARLAALHLPLRERILVYEHRIAELEKEVVTQSEEMRELIQATLSLVRQRLQEEKQKEFSNNGKG